MRKISKRSAVIAGVTVVALGGGAAWATVTGWGINGTGSAEAKAAEIKELSATSTFTKNLYPGLSTTMATTVKNPNEFKVALTGNAAVTKVEVTPNTDQAAVDCKNGLAGPDIFTTTFPGTPDIPAGANAHPVSSNVTVGNLPQACAGKTIKVSYSFTGVSKA